MITFSFQSELPGDVSRIIKKNRVESEIMQDNFSERLFHYFIENKSYTDLFLIDSKSVKSWIKGFAFAADYPEPGLYIQYLEEISILEENFITFKSGLYEYIFDKNFEAILNDYFDGEDF